MGDKTGIQWTDATWNCIVGCSLVSPGCTYCYAMSMAARIQRMTDGENRNRSDPDSYNANGRLKPIVSHYAGTTQIVKGKPVWTGKLVLAPDHILYQPLSWKKPRRIFVNSMGDVFHKDAPFEWVDYVFAIMSLSEHHIFQLLTKRSSEMRAYCNDPETPGRVMRAADAIAKARGIGAWLWPAWPLPNVWLGISAEDQRRADERCPDLAATPAAVRFVSAEPLLGPIDFNAVPIPFWASGSRLDQIIVGGESGHGARPMHPDWARSIRHQCAAAGVAYFHKQNGEFLALADVPPEWWNFASDAQRGNQTFLDGAAMIRVGKHRAGRLLDGIEHNGMPNSVT